MKKLLLALTLVLCLAVSMVALTSCGGEDDCEHIWATEATVDTAATCTQEGVKSIKCVECGEKKADSVTAIPAVGHAYDAGTTVAPTCTEDGSLTKTCAICGDVNVTVIPTAGEHTWSTEPIVDSYPTCTTDGQKSIKCTVCQVTKPDTTVVIPASHTWADGASVVVPATCTTEGVAAIKCTVCREVKPDTNEVIPATGHTDIDVVVVPTLFTEGRIKGTCSTCGVAVNEAIPTVDPSITEVTVTDEDNRDNVVREYELLGDVLGEGKHFYPTTENPEGRSLFIEFSLLLNDTMNNFVNSNISFPGIYTSTWLDSAYGKSAFWFYIKAADGIAQGGYDDWTSNAVDGADYYNAKPVLAMDGWHRFGFEFHQNTTINGDDVSYTMDVTMYIDGVKVYEATLGKKVEDTKNILLYTAEVVDGEVVYTDRTDAYAAYVRYTTYVTDSENPAYFIFADQYMSCDGFTYEVEPVSNPAAATLEVAEGVTVSAKQYYTYVKSVTEKLYDETLDSVEYPVDMITPADGTVDYSVNSGGTKYHRYQAHDNKRVAFIKIKDIAFNTVNIGVADGATVRYTFFSKMPTEYNEVVSYAIQYRTFIDATADVSVEIPANADYLVLYYQDNADTKYLPESITFTNNSDTLSEKLKDNTLETLKYPVSAIKPSQGTIATASLRYIPNFDWVACFVDITDCAFEQVTLVVNGNTGNVGYGFLTMAPDIYDYVEFAGDGTPMTYYSEQPAGTSYTIDIPEDAKVLVIYYQDEGPIYYTPASVTFVNTDPDEPTEGGGNTDDDTDTVDGYAYPMDTVTPANGFINHNYKMGDAGKTHKFKTAAGERVAFIDLADIDYDTVTVTSNGETAFFAFLTKIPTDNDEVVSYAINYNDMLAIDGTVTLDIPANAKYIAVTYAYDSGTVCLPESIVFTDTENTPNDSLKNEALDSYEYPMGAIKVSQGTIASADNKYVANFDWTSAFVSIEGCVFDKVVLEVNSVKGCVGYGFLTDYPTIGEAVSYAGGATAMTFVKDKTAGETITVDIPDDAKVLVVYWHDWDDAEDAPVYIKPESITFIKAEDAGNVVPPAGGDSEDAETTTPGGSTDSEDAETTTPTNPGFGSASDSEDSENAGTTTPANPGFGSASDSEDAG